ECVALVAEILNAYPNLARIGNQVRTPIIEDLQAAGKNVRLLDVDPIVLYQGRPAWIFVRNLQTIEQQSNGDEVAIEQSVVDLAHGRGDVCAAHRANQL